MFRTTLDKLTAIRDEKKAEDGGFTLIELLVVVVIIGILIAIAIPLYLNYEKGSHDSAAESDLRAAITDVDQCYSSNNNVYPASATLDTTNGTEQYTMPDASSCTTESNLSSGTVMAYAPDGTGFALSAKNSNGTANVEFYYDSNSGSGVTSTEPAGFPTLAVA